MLNTMLQNQQLDAMSVLQSSRYLTFNTVRGRNFQFQKLPPTCQCEGQKNNSEGKENG